MILLSDRIRIFNFEVPMGPGMSLPGRCTIARATDGRLIIFSPGPFTEVELKTLRGWGTVAAIVAPNLMHHKWVARALEAFPDARFFRPDEMAARFPEIEGRGEPFEKLKFLAFDDMQFIPLRGVPRAQECVFFFPKDRLLLVTDLVFHILKSHGFISNLILTVMGTKGRLATSKMLKALVKDPVAFGEDLRQMLQWDFDKVVMAHGEPLIQNAKERMETALTKFL